MVTPVGAFGITGAKVLHASPEGALCAVKVLVAIVKHAVPPLARIVPLITPATVVPPGRVTVGNCVHVPRTPPVGVQPVHTTSYPVISVDSNAVPSVLRVGRSELDTPDPQYRWNCVAVNGYHRI